MTDIPIYSFGLTDVGGRKTNEDAFYVSDRREPAKLAARGRLFIVADGTGGQEGGRTASSWANEIVAENYYDNSSEDLGESLRTSIQTAQRALFRLSQEVSSWSSLSTTIVAVVIKGQDLWVAHVGDSRLYLVRGSKTRQVTRDHVWDQDDENNGSLTRWLGGGNEATVEVDLAHETLQDGDAILLCTDGLYSLFSQNELGQIVQRTGVKPTVEQLIAQSKLRGTSDNVTAIAVRYGGTVIEGAQKRRQLMLIGGGLAAAAVVVVFLVLASGNPPNPQATSTPSGAVRITVSVDSVTAASIGVDATQPPAGTAGPTSTRRPTSTATSTRVPPTATHTPTVTAIPPTELPTPTPGGGDGGGEPPPPPKR